MSLSETTRSVLRLVEERSGIPVHVEPDPNLPGTILAKVVMARENLLLHRIFYRPNSTTPPDYLICQQAGFILRFFAVPADRRFDFAASDAGTKAVEELVKAHPVAKMLPPQALPQLTMRPEYRRCVTTGRKIARLILRPSLLTEALLGFFLTVPPIPDLYKLVFPCALTLAHLDLATATSLALTAR
jgi:hypothetical protein